MNWLDQLMSSVGQRMPYLGGMPGQIGMDYMRQQAPMQHQQSQAQPGMAPQVDEQSRIAMILRMLKGGF